MSHSRIENRADRSQIGRRRWFGNLIGLGLGSLLFSSLASCQLFGGLSEKEEIKLAVYIQQARAYYDSRDYDASEQQARKALAIEDDNATANLLLGWTLIQQRSNFKVKEAESVFTDMLERGNVNFKTNYGLAITHYQLALTEAARSEQLKRWRTNRIAREKAARKSGISPPTDEELEEMIVQADLEHVDHLTNAITQLDEVLELNPGYPPALLSRGQIHLLRLEDDKALENFEYYLRLAESTRKDGLTPERFIEAGMSPTERELINETLDGLVKSNIKKDITVRIEAANIHFKKGRYDKALEHLNQAIELDPNSLLPYLNRAECYGEMGQYDAAVSDLEVFVRKSDRDYDDVMEKASRLLARYSQAKGK